MIEDNRMDVCRILRVVSNNNLEKYLGLSAIVGRDKNRAFSDLQDKYNKRIHNRSSKLSSLGGKELYQIGFAGSADVMFSPTQ